MPSVRDVINAPSLALEELFGATSDAEVRWVATSELPDPSPYLEGGEILLTTGLGTHEWASEWNDYTARLKAAGVVALGFAIGLTHDSVPSQLLEAARRHELTLFTVPPPTPFIAISRAIAEMIASEERAVDREALAHQRELTRAALSPGGRHAILETLASLADGTALLLDAEGGLLSSPAPDPHLLQRVRPLLERLRNAGMRGATSDISGERSIVIHPIGLNPPAGTFLAVEFPTATGPTATRMAVAAAVALLSLDQERSATELAADRRLRAAAITLLLRGEEAIATSLLAAAPDASDRALPATVRVVRARGDADIRERALLQLEGLAGHRPLIADVASAGAKRLSARADGELVAVCDAHGEEVTDALARWSPALHVGVGPAVPIQDAGRSDAAASAALAHATAARPVVAWAELATEGIAGIIPPNALEAFASDLLEPLRSSPDAEALMEAVRTYLAQHGNSRGTASALGIHRNTLRQRLARAESLLARSLTDPQTRADLWLALTAREMPVKASPGARD